jgi:hypothetical protein
MKRIEILVSLSDTSMFARSTLAHRPAHIDRVNFRLPKWPKSCVHLLNDPMMPKSHVNLGDIFGTEEHNQN